MMCTPVKASITPQLIQEWNKQPPNVQWSVFYQNTSIDVVDKLPWESPELAETWAYTSKYKDNNGMVNHIDIVIKKGYETALTHEVGHCLQDQFKVPDWWVIQPAFIKIWLDERLRLPQLAGQGYYDIREYFAEAYSMYIHQPKILKLACPSTFNYIKLVLQYK